MFNYELKTVNLSDQFLTVRVLKIYLFIKYRGRYVQIDAPDSRQESFIEIKGISPADQVIICFKMSFQTQKNILIH